MAFLSRTSDIFSTCPSSPYCIPYSKLSIGLFSLAIMQASFRHYSCFTVGSSGFSSVVSWHLNVTSRSILKSSFIKFFLFPSTFSVKQRKTFQVQYNENKVPFELKALKSIHLHLAA